MAVVVLTTTSASPQTWMPDCPAGTSIKVDLWGAGSGGSGRGASGFGAGGAGGAFATGTYVVTASDVTNGIPYILSAGSVGTTNANSIAGPDTSWASGTILAKGGRATSGTTGGLGGAAASCVPTLGAFSGGNGATRAQGAGAGGAAGPNGAGASSSSAVGETGDNGSGGTHGISNVLGGGGGSGNATAGGTAEAGGAPGAGGGGKTSSTGTNTGGAGGRGQIRLTYTTFSGKSTIAGASSVSATGAAKIAARSGIFGSGFTTTTENQRLAARLSAIAGSGVVAVNGIPLYSARAAIAGIGTVLPVETIFIQGVHSQTYPAKSNVIGGGAIVVHETVKLIANTGVFGTGSLAVRGTVRSAGSMSVAGVGGVAVTGTSRFVARSVIPGQGTVTVTANVVSQSQSPSSGAIGYMAIGVGHIGGEDVISVYPAESAIAGAGSVATATRATLPGRAGIFGIGSISVAANQRIAGSSAIAGIGAVANVNSIAKIFARSAIAGTGTISVHAEVNSRPAYSAESYITGSGAVAVNGVVRQIARLNPIVGAGTVIVNTRQTQNVVRLSIVGAGTVTVRGSLIQTTQVDISGQSRVFIDVHTTTTFPISATIEGVGSVGVSARVKQLARIVAIRGDGQVYVDARSHEQYAELFPILGTGLVRVDAEVWNYVAPYVPPAPPTVVDTYASLIPAYNAIQPRFMATLRALLAPTVALQSFLQSMPSAFDLDTAIGTQLDQVGIWIGRSRFVEAPIVGVYFSWDIIGLGWEQGTWQGAFDPSEGLQTLDDGTYRQLLYAKVAANNWDGTITGIVNAIKKLFGDMAVVVTVTDNQDMTMSVSVTGIVSSMLFRSLLLGGYVPIKPEGVQLTYVLSDAPPPTGPTVWHASVAIAGSGSIAVSTRQNMRSSLAVQGQGIAVTYAGINGSDGGGGTNYIIVNEPHVFGAGVVASKGALTAVARTAIAGAGIVTAHAELASHLISAVPNPVVGAGRTTISVPAVQTRIVNFVRNPRAEGASPGVLPTDWDLTDYNASGIGVAIIGPGVETNIPYLDVHLSGTPVPGVSYFTVRMSTVTGGVTGVAAGTTWSVSNYLRVISGSLNGINQIQTGFYVHNAGSYVNAYAGATLYPINTDPLANQFKFADNLTIIETVDMLNPGVFFEFNGAAVELVIRIGAPKAERAATSSTQLILPAPGTIPAQGYGTSIVF